MSPSHAVARDGRACTHEFPPATLAACLAWERVLIRLMATLALTMLRTWFRRSDGCPVVVALGIEFVRAGEEGDYTGCIRPC